MSHQMQKRGRNGAVGLLDFFFASKDNNNERQSGRKIKQPTARRAGGRQSKQLGSFSLDWGQADDSRQLRVVQAAIAIAT